MKMSFIIPILRRKLLRHREFKQFVLGHTDNKSQILDSIPGTYVPRKTCVKSLDPKWPETSTISTDVTMWTQNVDSEYQSGRCSPVRGHSFTWKKGVSGLLKKQSSAFIFLHAVGTLRNLQSMCQRCRDFKVRHFFKGCFFDLQLVLFMLGHELDKN